MLIILISSSMIGNENWNGKQDVQNNGRYHSPLGKAGTGKGCRGTGKREWENGNGKRVSGNGKREIIIFPDGNFPFFSRPAIWLKNN